MKKLIIMTEDRFERLIQERLAVASQEANKSYELDLLMKQADIQALQSQINPHFLYNSLECIRGQALLDGSQDIADITQALSHFFRYSISRKGDMVTLREELDNVKSYIMIQQFRFKNRFTYQVAVEPEEDKDILLEALLPKLTLQPVIENAIVHGFSQIPSGGKLTVRIQGIDKHISLSVSDNGKGMTIRELDAITMRMQGGSAPLNENHTGIGISNVNRRIKLYFGSDYGMGINSGPSLGTTVELHFPITLAI